MNKPRAITLPAQPAGRGPNGRRFCRWCQKEVPVGRRSWCSQECVDDYSVRSNPGIARSKVLARDNRVCADCNLNMNAVATSITRQARKLGLYGGYRREWFRKVAHQSGVAAHRLFTEWCNERGALYPARRFPTRRGRAKTDNEFAADCLWDMDHIVPVSEGGGGCGLDNLRTLCLWCHRRETVALKRRLATAARRARGRPVQSELFEVPT